MKIDLQPLRDILIPAANEILLSHFTQVEREHKTDGSVITKADLAMQESVAIKLASVYPETVFLGEEMSHEEQSHLLASSKPVWCFDPLDGTSNFASGIPYFSTSLALIFNEKVILGLVYDPVRDECFSASEDEAANLNGQALSMSKSGLTLSQSTAIIDFKRLSAELSTRLVTDIPYSSQRSFGSVALDWCWLAANRGHVYLHGRSNIWDYSASNYIFRKAGGYSCTLSGEPVFTNELIGRSSVAATDKDLFDEWTTWLGVSGV
ncbi:MAG: inositol monophosphatase family protein [Gammaproteobacteria bacterium]|nr:inositol monophosphatase family protein [Gammaproteobacteria bacterium]